MESYEEVWKAMESYGQLWTAMESYGRLWTATVRAMHGYGEGDGRLMHALACMAMHGAADGAGLGLDLRRDQLVARVRHVGRAGELLELGGAERRAECRQAAWPTRRAQSRVRARARAVDEDVHQPVLGEGEGEGGG